MQLQCCKTWLGLKTQKPKFQPVTACTSKHVRAWSLLSCKKPLTDRSSIAFHPAGHSKSKRDYGVVLSLPCLFYLKQHSTEIAIISGMVLTDCLLLCLIEDRVLLGQRLQHFCHSALSQCLHICSSISSQASFIQSLAGPLLLNVALNIC